MPWFPRKSQFQATFWSRRRRFSCFGWTWRTSSSAMDEFIISRTEMTSSSRSYVEKVSLSMIPQLPSMGIKSCSPCFSSSHLRIFSISMKLDYSTSCCRRKCLQRWQAQQRAAHCPHWQQHVAQQEASLAHNTEVETSETFQEGSNCLFCTKRTRRHG